MAFSSPFVRRSVARRAPVLLALVALAPALAACGDDEGNDSSADTTGSTAQTTPTTTEPAATTTTEPAAPTTTPDAAAGCRAIDEPEARTGEPELSAPSPARLTGPWRVTVRTNCGAFTIRLDTKRQPKTTASFRSLVAGRFYDGLSFHRIVPGFVIQGGDPAGTGAGGPGYSVRETPPPDAAYIRGVVAMAKTEAEPAGTSGSQFYVVTADDSGLPPDYAIVGEVTEGMATIDRIAALGTPDGGPPTSPVVITKATARRG